MFGRETGSLDKKSRHWTDSVFVRTLSCFIIIIIINAGNASSLRASTVLSLQNRRWKLHVLHASLCASVALRQSVRASETICFRNISNIYRWIFARQTSVIGASWDKDELIRFWVKRSKVKVILSIRRRPAFDAAVEFSFLI